MDKCEVLVGYKYMGRSLRAEHGAGGTSLALLSLGCFPRIWGRAGLCGVAQKGCWLHQGWIEALS